jgi:hypothetical protein
MEEADFTSIMTTMLDPSEEVLSHVLDDRRKLASAYKELLAWEEEVSNVYFEGRKLHPDHREFRLRLANLSANVARALKENTETKITEHFKGVKLLSPKDEVTIEPTYSDAAKDSEKPVPKGLSWAEMVEEDLGILVANELNGSTSLISAIRNKAGLKSENRILVPANLKETLPHMWSRFQTACTLSKSEMVLDNSVKITLARPAVWGDDIVARDNLLASLYDDKGNPKSELAEIADLSSLIENMLELPSVESLASAGPGRTGLWHSVSLVSRIYCEQAFDVPIAKQRNWWKVGGQIREKMRSELSNQLGGSAPALLVLNAFDILYRKFVRHVLRSKNQEHVKKMHDLIASYSPVLFNKGGALFNSLLRSETKERKVSKDVPDKKGKVQRVQITEKYTVKIRPKIADGPRTGFESSVYAKVNSALAKIESRADDYNLNSKKYSSPTVWEKEHKDWVEGLYQKTKIASHLMVQRKQNVRAKIMAKISESDSSSGKGAAAVPTQLKITQAQWIASEAALMAEHEEQFDLEAIRALNSMLGQSFKKDRLISVTEEELIDLFCDL